MSERAQPCNARAPWSDSDLRALSDLVRRRTELADVARTLGRSEAAVRHALVKLLFRGMRRYASDDLVAFYHLNPDVALPALVADKYDLEHREPAVGERDGGCGSAFCRGVAGFLATFAALTAAALWIGASAAAAAERAA